MDPAVNFYQPLAGISFTLLGLWFAIASFANGGWHGDPRRQRSTLHIALHFLIPGMAALASLLAGGSEGASIWRVTFIVAGGLGIIEAMLFLRSPGGPMALPGRILRLLDPALYAGMVAAALLPPTVLPIWMTPLQLAGMVTGSIFLIGLVYVWLAFAETGPQPAPDAIPAQQAGDVPRPDDQVLARSGTARERH